MPRGVAQRHDHLYDDPPCRGNTGCRAWSSAGILEPGRDAVDAFQHHGQEFLARFAAGKQKGKQAGTWRPVDQRVQLIPGAVDKSLIFVQHNLAGSRAAAPGVNQWTIEWDAPPAPAGPVQFNVASNASNNDDSPLGDFIYVKTVRSEPPRH